MLYVRLLQVEGFLYWIFSVKDNFVIFEMNGKYLHRVRVVQKFEISKDRDVCFLADNPKGTHYTDT